MKTFIMASMIGIAATAAIGLFVGATTSLAPSPPAGIALDVKTERESQSTALSHTGS